MKLISYKRVKPQKIDHPESKDVKIRWAISEEDGALNFALRVFELKPGGYTPYHSHKWEHEVFIKKGKGKLFWEGRNFSFKEGDVVFIPGGEKHQFKNSSRGILEFLCIIPIKTKR